MLKNESRMHKWRNVKWQMRQYIGYIWWTQYWFACMDKDLKSHYALILIKLESWRRKLSRATMLWRNGKPMCNSGKRHGHMHIYGLIILGCAYIINTREGMLSQMRWPMLFVTVTWIWFMKKDWWISYEKLLLVQRKIWLKVRIDVTE